MLNACCPTKWSDLCFLGPLICAVLFVSTFCWSQEAFPRHSIWGDVLRETYNGWKIPCQLAVPTSWRNFYGEPGIHSWEPSQYAVWLSPHCPEGMPQLAIFRMHCLCVVGFFSFIPAVWWLQMLVWLGIFQLFSGINISARFQTNPSCSIPQHLADLCHELTGHPHLFHTFRVTSGFTVGSKKTLAPRKRRHIKDSWVAEAGSSSMCSPCVSNLRTRKWPFCFSLWEQTNTESKPTGHKHSLVVQTCADPGFWWGWGVQMRRLQDQWPQEPHPVSLKIWNKDNYQRQGLATLHAVV